MSARKRYAEGTEVPVDRTRAELESLLAKHGATQTVVYRDTQPPLRGRIIFRISERMVRLDVIPKLPAVAPRRRMREDWRVAALQQAERESWRRLLLVVKAKLEMIADEVSTIEREFLADILLPDSSTVYETLRDKLDGVYTSGKVPPLLPAFED
jgi:hypothetical protein